MIIVGVVGGIGSGKSAVCRWVAERDPSIRVIDADRDGHRALALPDVRDQLQAEFGPDILGPDGLVSRPALAARVFGPSAEQQAARLRLEQIVHPAIERLREQQLAEFDDGETITAVLLDAPLLLEAGWKHRCDAVVFIEVPREIRLQRVHARGWNSEELSRREASQWPIERKRAEADFIVDNGRTLDNSGSQMYEYIQRLVASAAK
ncbi:Dephospho-CoA kinase [Caulifigura coniformis]|uniref:Dephospho-CoA kinase n=1 Tax=Caulifigura coniformis TaxID=2527983 RepID=A0A517SGN0_9PLAN|nr:dephospho-CoA kinase [Caulifigura coniformis]QDT55283.1 Dephospho-CoA kinase [Caulifigura coniformis]